MTAAAMMMTAAAMMFVMFVMFAADGMDAAADGMDAAAMMFAAAAMMFAAAVVASVRVAAVVMPAVPAFVAAKAKAAAEFVADDVPARAIPAVVIPAVGLALEAVFFVPAFDRRRAAFAGLHYRPHCAKPARGDGPAFYLAVFHVQILVPLPPVSYADVRSIRILYRLNSPHCA